MRVNGDRIRLLRMAARHTQDDLAEAASTTTRTIQRAEAGSASPDTIDAIARALRVAPEQLSMPEPLYRGAPDLARLEYHIAKNDACRAERTQIVNRLCERWRHLVPGDVEQAWQRRRLEVFVQRFSPEEVYESMTAAADQYVRFEKGKPTADSIAEAFEKIGAICFVRKADKQQPGFGEVFRLRGILSRRNLEFYDADKARGLLENALIRGLPLPVVEQHVRVAPSWHTFCDGILRAIESGTGALVSATEGMSTQSISSTSDSAQTIPIQRRLPPPPLAASDVLWDAQASGEHYITINYERREYYFGRTRNGFGTVFPVGSNQAQDELSYAMREGFRRT